MKKLRKIMAFLLALVMVLALCACTKPMPIAAGKTTVGVKDGETVGQGATAFSVEVKDAEGKATKFTVQTDEKTVGAALQKLNIISGEDSQYGLYIKEVTGITADYDKVRFLFLGKGRDDKIEPLSLQRSCFPRLDRKKGRSDCCSDESSYLEW